jgi:hypothetical protein
VPEQGDLFDFNDEPEAPYQRHSETSYEAAVAIEPDTASLRGQVLAFIRAQGESGATDDEVQVALEMNPSTERPRRIELWAAGLVWQTRSKRPTRSGRSATVWVAAG